jgi:hypothetical protein
MQARLLVLGLDDTGDHHPEERCRTGHPDCHTDTRVEGFVLAPTSLCYYHRCEARTSLLPERRAVGLYAVCSTMNMPMRQVLR